MTRHRVDPMQLTVIYRTYDGDNPKHRPPFYSKLRCFQSLLLALRRVPSARLVVAVDSLTLPPGFAPLVERHAAELHHFDRFGNTRSYRATFPWVRALRPDEIVYYAEDDYLYVESAFEELGQAVAAMPEVDYFTLFDHLDRYIRNDDASFGRRERVWVAGSRHWRTVESTCMTFAGRAGRLQADLPIHDLLSRRTIPKDRMIWRAKQGIGAFFWKFPKRHLVSPIPALATHMDPDALSPNVDWGEVAAGVDRAAHLL